MNNLVSRNLPALAVSCLILGAFHAGIANAERPGPKAIAFDDPAIEWLPCPEFIPEGCRLAVLQGDPAQRNADIFFKLPPDTKVPRHLHTSAERMVLVSGEFHVDYDGHDTVVMRPGTYAYGPAGLPHTAKCAAGAPCVLFIAFEEAIDAIPVED